MSFTILADSASYFSTENPDYNQLLLSIEAADKQITALENNLDTISKLSRSNILKNIKQADIQALTNSTEQYFLNKVHALGVETGIEQLQQVTNVQSIAQLLESSSLSDPIKFKLQDIVESDKVLANLRDLFDFSKGGVSNTEGDLYGIILDTLTGERAVTTKGQAGQLDYDFSRVLIKSKIKNDQYSRLQVTNYIFANKNYQTPIKKHLGGFTEQIQQSLQQAKSHFLELYSKAEDQQQLVPYLQVLNDVTGYFSGLMIAGQRAKDTSDFGSKTIYTFFEKWQSFKSIRSELTDSSKTFTAAQQYKFGEGASYGVLLTQEQIAVKKTLDNFLTELVGKYKNYLSQVNGESGYGSLSPDVERQETAVIRAEIVKQLRQISRQNNNIIPSSRLQQIEKYTELYSLRFLANNYFNKMIARQNPPIFWEPSISEAVDSISPESTYGDHLEDTYTNVTRPKIEEVISDVQSANVKIEYYPFMLGDSMYLIPSYAFNTQQQSLVLLAYVNQIWHRLSEGKRVKFQGKMTQYIEGTVGGNIQQQKVKDLKKLKSDLNQTFGFTLPVVIPDRTSVKDSVQIKSLNDRIRSLKVEIDKSLNKSKIKQKAAVEYNLDRDIDQLSREPFARKIERWIASAGKIVVTTPSDVRIQEFRDIKGEEIKLLVQAIEDLKYILGIDEDSSEIEENLLTETIEVAIRKSKQSLESYIKGQFPKEILFSLTQWEDSLSQYLVPYASRSLDYQSKFLELIFWDTLLSKVTRQRFPEGINLSLVISTIEENIDFDYILDDFSYCSLEEIRQYLSSVHTSILTEQRNKSPQVSADSIRSDESLSAEIQKLIPTVQRRIQQLKQKITQLSPQSAKIARRLKPAIYSQFNISQLITDTLTDAQLTGQPLEDLTLLTIKHGQLFNIYQFKRKQIDEQTLHQQFRYLETLNNQSFQNLVKIEASGNSQLLFQAKKDHFKLLLDNLNVTYQKAKFQNYTLTPEKEQKLFKLLTEVYRLGHNRIQKLKLYLQTLQQNDTPNADKFLTAINNLSTSLKQDRLTTKINPNLLREQNDPNFLKVFFRCLVLEQFLVPFTGFGSMDNFDWNSIDVKVIEQRCIQMITSKFVVSKKLFVNKIEAYLKYLFTVFSSQTINFDVVAQGNDELKQTLVQQQTELLQYEVTVKLYNQQIRKTLLDLLVVIKENIPNVIVANRRRKAELASPAQSEFWNALYSSIQEIATTDLTIENNKTILDNAFFELFCYNRILSQILQSISTKQLIPLKLPNSSSDKFNSVVSQSNPIEFVTKLLDSVEAKLTDLREFAANKGLVIVEQADIAGKVSLDKLRIKISELSKLVQEKKQLIRSDIDQIVANEVARVKSLLGENIKLDSKSTQDFILVGVERLFQANLIIAFATVGGTHSSAYRQYFAHFDRYIESKNASSLFEVIITECDAKIAELQSISNVEEQFESEEQKAFYDEVQVKLDKLNSKIQLKVSELDAKVTEAQKIRRLVFAAENFAGTWSMLSNSLDNELKKIDNPTYKIYARYLTAFAFYRAILEPSPSTENCIEQVKSALQENRQYRNQSFEQLRPQVQKLDSLVQQYESEKASIEESDRKSRSDSVAKTFTDLLTQLRSSVTPEDLTRVQQLKSVTQEAQQYQQKDLNRTPIVPSGFNFVTILKRISTDLKSISSEEQKYIVYLEGTPETSLTVAAKSVAKFIAVRTDKRNYAVFPIAGSPSQHVRFYRAEGLKLVPIDTRVVRTTPPLGQINAEFRLRRLFANADIAQYKNQFPSALSNLVEFLATYNTKVHDSDVANQKNQSLFNNLNRALSEKNSDYVKKLIVAINNIKQKL